jgi:site-specific DNA-adenine methylase
VRVYNHAPLNFIGQKRFWLNDLRHLTFNDDAIIVDVFGGSGLVAHTIKAANPHLRVVWNDYDNYAGRLNKLKDTEALRVLLVKALEDTYPQEHQKLTERQLEIIKNTIDEFDGDYDKEAVARWFAHQMNKKSRFGEMKYYNLRLTPYKSADDYLQGVERESADFKTIIDKYRSSDTVFICDPPYIFTTQSTYNKKAGNEDDDFHSSFALKDTIEMLKLLRDNPAYIFTSHKSELDAVCELMNIEYVKLSRKQCIAAGREYYEELYMINQAKKPRNHYSLFDNNHNERIGNGASI